MKNDLDELMRRVRWNPRGFYEIEGLTWDDICKEA